jgi:hypothetical protein
MTMTRVRAGFAAGALALGSILAAVGCGGGQTETARLETRPFEEQKAFEVVDGVLKERGYAAERDVQIELTTQARFQADFRVTGQKIAIEYVTDQDRVEIGLIPPAAQGSRLHVLQARTVPADASVPGETLYIFFLDDRDFTYQHNPTSEYRADVTITEVRSRLRRDLTDFFAWYESTMGKAP